MSTRDNTMRRSTDLTNHAGGHCDKTEVEATPERFVLGHFQPPLANWIGRI